MVRRGLFLARSLGGEVGGLCVWDGCGCVPGCVARTFWYHGLQIFHHADFRGIPQRIDLIFVGNVDIEWILFHLS